MEQLRKRKTFELNGNAFGTLGLLFLSAGVIGRGVIQAHILNVGSVSTAQLLEIMQTSDVAMTLATVSLVLQAIETCAAPIFALMLVNGMQYTAEFKAYLLRMAGLALLTEIPYNLAMNASVFAFDSRNPVFGMVLCLVMLYFFQRYSEKKIQNTLIKAVVTLASVIWAEMLRIEFGACMVILAAVLWALREKPIFRNIAGATAAIVCSLVSPFFMASPFGVIVIHFYNGEKPANSRRIRYLAYPAILLAAAAVGLII